VYVVGDDHVAHQRLITIQHEQDDIFIIKSGLDPHDKIVLEGIRQLSEGQKLDEFEFKKPEEALAHQKFPAE
jgi:membrane fusion protein (multidrug efflux system)